MERHDASETVVATYHRRIDADEAIHALHHAGYHHTWLGVTRTVDENTFGGAGGTVGAGRERVQEADDVNLIARWLRHEGDRTLYDVLRDHGVEDEDARAIDGSVVEGECVLVVEDAHDPRRVARIVRETGGTLRSEIAEPVAAPRKDAPQPATRTLRTLREDVFVRRRLPPSDKPSEY
ncbi:MAG TPA: hypothetical protein VE591_02165 [Candidatus Acidoferrum sp.]|jgi:hypothetical protein|nr:hypothetical protein [Candidatus Acidoferrum sp.]